MKKAQRGLLFGYPEKSRKFKIATQNWKKTFSRRDFYDRLGRQLGYVSFECWYKISVKDIKRYGGYALISRYFNGSIYDSVKAIFPEYPWIPWRFNFAPKNIWLNSFQRREFFDWLGRELGYISWECWYQISGYHIKRYGGSGLLSNYYKDSFYNALKEAFPEYPWIPWRFNIMPKNIWSDSFARREFFDWLGRELNYNTFSCWYHISLSEIQKRGGSGLLSTYYSSSAANAAKNIFPEYPWISWKFQHTPHQFWSNLTNQKSFIDYLGKELGFIGFPDFYRLKLSDIKAHGGTQFSNLYNHSTYRCLKSVLPEFNWVPGKFTKSPRRSIAPRIFDHSIFEIITPENPLDWYRISLSEIKEFGISTKAELISVLKRKFPEFRWDMEIFKNSGKKKLQWKLRRLVTEILGCKSPDISVLEDYLGFMNLNRSLSRFTELDIFVPSLNLALEYQGLQHFRDHFFFGPSKDYKLKDEQKRITCKRVGITLIQVPYDVSLDEASVADLVRKFRPDVIN